MSPPPAQTPSPGFVAAVLMPAVFVFLWSTGFIGAKLGLPYAEPMTFLALRFALVVAILAPLALLMRAPWPDRAADVGHIAIVGVLLHGVYLGGVFAAISLGVEAGTAALIVALQPILTAILAGPVLGERVSLRQWIGFFLGLAGVFLVVYRKLEQGLGTPEGMALAVMALFGITIGTLYQKRFCTQMDLRTGNAIQFAAAAVALGVIAFAIETREITWSGEFVFALGWLVLVMSIGAITLLMILIRQGAASKVSSLFFLVPASTALIAWPLFGETFGPAAIAGMVLVTVGVAMVNLGGQRPARRAAG